ncbi:MAG: hypothetical protein CFH01_01966 [Alphaproteobacteria bacterium MarineAlpha2_Bin1]|nr:MAG: hypothetical protein CFH01_01966 [Alphaproteobacteria bacterium MarineAlpha2_Bin1]
MRFLKFLVILMGILIIAGLTTIVITIYNRTSSNLDKQSNISISIPADATILSQTIDKNKLFVHIRKSNGDELIKVYDMINGKELKKIIINK